MNGRRVFFVNRFYWPDEPATAQLLTDLASALAAGGQAVTVIASHSADAATPRRETHNGVVIERVRTTQLGRRSLAGRALDFATFYPGAVCRLLRLARRGDVVVALTDPPFIGIFCWLAARVRGARIVHWVQDIYPEIAAELTGQRWLLVLRPLRNLAWRRADACVVVGADMARSVTAAGIGAAKTVVAANWAPAGLAPPSADDMAALRAEWGLGEKFVVAYSGNLGRVHYLDPLLEVAAALRADPDFIFIFIGNGARRTALEATAKTRALANVRFFPPQPRHRLAATLGVAEVHFVTLQPGADRWVFPSKLYGIAAVGRPVIFVGSRDCELARLVAGQGFGAAFAGDDTASIVATLRLLRADPIHREAMGSAALDFAAGGAAAAVKIWTKLLAVELARAAPAS